VGLQFRAQQPERTGIAFTVTRTYLQGTWLGLATITSKLPQYLKGKQKIVEKQFTSQLIPKLPRNDIYLS